MTAPLASEPLAGRFVIEREVGRGGVGIVYRARDEVTGAPVALKVIALPGVDAGEEARFRREGRVLAGLRHRGIVQVVAFGQLDDGQPYIAMEWLEGEDIAQRQRRSRLPLSQCVSIAADVADALAAAHAAGIVHRDVKPSNVFLVGSASGGASAPPPSSAPASSERDPSLPPPPFHVKLVDFGVASAEDAKLTRTGAIVGTPAYMAPEQARGDGEVDARADLYALGATLFEMIAGRPPHVGPTPIAILARLVTTPAPHLSEVVPDVPLRLEAIVSRLLATAPAERPASAREVAHELRAIVEDLRTGDGGAVVPGSLSPHAPHASMHTASSTTDKSGGTRMVTTIVATRVPKGAVRARLLTHLRARGADATELGGDAIVCHLGVRKTVGDEAVTALDLGMRVARINATVGVATGRTRIDRTRPTGEVVDRAAALARDAARGQVLADTTTTELTRGRYELQLRGDGSAVVGTPLPGRKDAGGGVPFVGREAELAQIVAAFERSVEDRTPIVVTVTGAPGMGKTRLRREALSRIVSHASTPRVLSARSESFSKSHALGVVADVARGLTGVAKGAPLQEALDATDVLIATSEVPCSHTSRELIARLVANEPLPELDDTRGARDGLWLVLTEMVLGMSKQQPLAIVLEDVQWADAESLSWVDHLLARSAGSTVFVLAAARPAFWRESAARFEGRDHVRIELRPLSRKQARAIAVAVLGDRAAGDKGEAVVESIAQQSAGLPLFAEELARIAAAGRDAADAPTIEAAMQVHLDALDDFGRDAASKLSVFGHTGWDVGLESIGVPHAPEVLRELAAAEILVEQAHARFASTREFSFKHALMREVAYAALGEEQLREYHRRAGLWLAKVGEDDAIVARHLELGGDEIASAQYLEKAARRALAAHALPAAVSLAEKALAFAEDKPTQFARAQLLDEAWNRLDARAAERDSAVRAMQESVYDRASEVRAAGARVRYEDACGGGADTSTNLDEVRRQAQEAKLYDEEARCAAALAARYAYAGELDAAQKVADALLELARRHAIAVAAVDAWQTLAVVRQTRGEVAAALEARRSAAQTASAAGLKTREATLTINVGFALTTVGARAEARQAIESGIALGQAVGSPGVERHGKMILLGWAATFGTDPSLDGPLADARSAADAALAGSWVPHDRAALGVLFYRGMEKLRAPGHEEDARTLLRLAAQGYRATKMLDVLPVARGLWAEAERRCGEAERARELASEAASLLDEGSPSLLNEAPVFLALHDACVDLGMLGEAKQAIARGVPRLVTRTRGLAGTPYARTFLTGLAANAGLLAAAEAYDLVPDEIATAIAEDRASSARLE
ncbi:MAG TPA: protein kinase [Polyangiaceae bacterium]|jgi:serine/threonine protein kinase/tetratricopeptide (TPR) repeat protein|nr:protein kinase [Polyangiaceae bacterium]